MPTPGAPSASVNDKATNSYVDNGDGTFSQRTAAAASVGTQTVQSVADQSTNQWNSSLAGGSITTPVAGNAVTTLTPGASAGAGYYVIQVQYGYGATAEATTVNNFKLVVAGVTIGPLAAPLSAANQQWGGGIKFRFKLAAGDVVSVTVISNASAGAIYTANLVATREA